MIPSSSFGGDFEFRTLVRNVMRLLNLRNILVRKEKDRFYWRSLRCFVGVKYRLTGVWLLVVNVNILF